MSDPTTEDEELAVAVAAQTRHMLDLLLPDDAPANVVLMVVTGITSAVMVELRERIDAPWKEAEPRLTRTWALITQSVLESLAGAEADDR